MARRWWTDSLAGVGSKMGRKVEWLCLLFSSFATLLSKETNSNVVDKAPWKEPLRWSVLWRWTAHLFVFCSVSQSCPTLCDPMDCSMPSSPVHHQFLELTQTHVHWIDDAIQPSHPLSSPSPPTFNLSQHQGLSKRVSSLHQVAKILEFQLQHQSFQWIFRVDFL